MRYPLGVAALAATAALTVAACGSSGSETSSADESTSTSTTSSTAAVNSGAVVDIASLGGKFLYEPSEQTVKVGEAVTWVNTDTRKHTVTATPGQTVDFSSPNILSEEEYVQTFDTPGTYTYFCSIHGEDVMSGSITVTP